MDVPHEVVPVARRQRGVLTVAQLDELGVPRSLVHRRVVAGRWRRLHPGIVVVHSGPVGWQARASGALLHAGPGAALSHRAAGFVHGLVPTAPPQLTVSIPHERRVVPVPGVQVVRRRVMPPAGGTPRVVRLADVVVDLAEQTRDVDAMIALVAAAARSGAHPAEVRHAAQQRARLTHRALLLELVGEVAEGVESPLELRYRRDVGRRHGLPAAELQVRERLGGGRIRADCRYRGLGVRVELDGRLAHPGGRTDADTWRDNLVLLAHAEVTLRYRWYHVAVTPCATASQVARALRAGGWTGRPHPCGPTCRLT